MWVTTMPPDRPTSVFRLSFLALYAMQTLAKISVVMHQCADAVSMVSMTRQTSTQSSRLKAKNKNIAPKMIIIYLPLNV